MPFVLGGALGGDGGGAGGHGEEGEGEGRLEGGRCGSEPCHLPIMAFPAAALTLGRSP